MVHLRKTIETEKHEEIIGMISEAGIQNIVLCLPYACKYPT